MLNLQSRGLRATAGRPPLGDLLGSILGAPPANRFPMYDPRGGPYDNTGAPDRDANHATPRIPDFVDSSPPDLPPMNAPGANRPEPLQDQRANYRAMLEEAL